MSLQVWLPFNGDFNSQGLKQVKIINNKATFDINGKIGQCCNIASGQYLGFDAANQNNHKYPYISIACWVYPTQSDSTERYVICCYENGGCGINLKNTKLGGQVYVGGYKSCYTPTTITLNTWHHICMTYNGSKLCLYLNGKLVSSLAVSGPITYHNTCPWQIAGNPGATTFGSNNFIGKINDLRMYDHALSAKEVEEIAKGLVLHYKLDGPKESVPAPEIPENLFIGSGFSTNDVANMVSNSSTDWTKYFRWYNGSKAIHSFSDGVDTITLNSTGNLGIAFQRKATDINLDSNSYYTISCEAKCTKSGAQLSIGTSYYTTSNAWTWRGGTNKVSFNAVNTWQTFTLTFKPDSNTKYICYCFTCANGTSGGTHTLSIRHCKLEKGSTATEWTLNELDDTYIAPVQDNTWTKEFDCSGYGNDATIIGIPTIESNSARFSQCIHMTNTNTANHIQSNNNVPLLTDGITASFWVKCAKATGQVIFAHPNFEFGLLNSLGYVSLTAAAGFNLSNFITNEWNHICVIRNGTTYKLYVNGIAATQNGANNNYVHNASNLYLLNRSYNNNYAANASLSDFRIYATELTEAQIKELYNTSATIDNKGNGYAREEIEDSNLNITKTGQFHNEELLDSDDYTTASITKTNKQLKVNNFYEY